MDQQPKAKSQPQRKKLKTRRKRKVAPNRTTTKPGLPLGLREMPKLPPVDTSGLERLQARLAALRKRRKATETRVRDRLVRARLLAEEDVVRTMSSEQARAEDRAEFVTRVVRREIRRPLQFTDEQVAAFEQFHRRFESERQLELARNRALYRQASLLAASRSLSTLGDPEGKNSGFHSGRSSGQAPRPSSRGGGFMLTGLPDDAPVAVTRTPASSAAVSPGRLADVQTAALLVSGRAGSPPVRFRAVPPPPCRNTIIAELEQQARARHGGSTVSRSGSASRSSSRSRGRRGMRPATTSVAVAPQPMWRDSTAHRGASSSMAATAPKYTALSGSLARKRANRRRRQDEGGGAERRSSQRQDQSPTAQRGIRASSPSFSLRRNESLAELELAAAAARSRAALPAVSPVRAGSGGHGERGRAARDGSWKRVTAAEAATAAMEAEAEALQALAPKLGLSVKEAPMARPPSSSGADAAFSSSLELGGDDVEVALPPLRQGDQAAVAPFDEDKQQTDAQLVPVGADGVV